MKIVVQRMWSTPESVCGQMFIDGILECATLEPPFRSDGSKPRAIPAGTYDLAISYSPRFGRLIPHVENVPGFTEVEIHWGNFPDDTEACTLVGTTHGDNFVGHSVEAFNLLFVKLQAGVEEGAVTITYVDPLSTEEGDAVQVT